MSLIPPDAPPQFGKGAQPIPPDPNDLIVSSALLQLAATGIDYSSPYRVPNRPPVTNQGNTPECVAYSSATEQNLQDYTEHRRFYNFDEHRFFVSIGGTSAGAVTRNGLDRMLHDGYPEQDDTPSATQHKIAAYFQVPLNRDDLKRAIYAFRGTLWVGNWFASWEHPVGDLAVLPAPSGSVSGHQFEMVGWNSIGVVGEQSWGTLWGDKGYFVMPWSYLIHAWSAWKTADDKTVTQVFTRAQIRDIGDRVYTTDVLGDNGTLEGNWFATAQHTGIRRRRDKKDIATPWDRAFPFKGFRHGARHGIGRLPSRWGVIEINRVRRAVPAANLKLVS